jgi:hypothetical protein
MGLEQVFDPATCESITLLDTFGGNDPRTVFVDDTWKDVPPGMVSSFVRVRMNEISSSHIQFLKQPLVTLKEICKLNHRYLDDDRRALCAIEGPTPTLD